MTCNQCFEDKELSEFPKRSDCLDGYRKVCKKCYSDNNNKYYLENKEIIDAKHKKYDEDNKERFREYYRQYRLDNKDKIMEWKSNNKELINRSNLEYRKRRSLEDPQYKFKKLLRNNIASAFRRFSKNGKVKPSAEYGIDFEAIFKYVGPRPGTGKEWHLDHIIPISLFDFDDPEHVRMCHIPENFQWLRSGDNLAKAATLMDYILNIPKLVEVLQFLGITL